MQDGSIGVSLAVEASLLEVERLATDDAAAMLDREERLAPLQVAAIGATLGKPPVGFVEGHPLAVLSGLTLAGWERRQALVVERDTVAAAVFGQAIAELLRCEARPATARAVGGQLDGGAMQRLGWRGRNGVGRATGALGHARGGEPTKCTRILSSNMELI